MYNIFQAPHLNIALPFLQSEGKKYFWIKSCHVKWLFLLAAFLSNDSLIPFKKTLLDKNIWITKAVYIAAKNELECHSV